MFCCVWEMGGDRDRLLYWPKFFSWPEQHFFRILAGVAQPWVTEGPKLSVCKLVLTLRSTAEGTQSIFLPNVHLLQLIYTGASLDWRLGRGSIYNNHHILIFQNSTRGHFSHVLLHPPHTQILQIMLKDNNSKNTKRNYLKTTKYKNLYTS